MRRPMRTMFALILTTGLALVTVGTVAAQQPKKEKEDPNVRSVEGLVVDSDQKPVPQAVIQLKDLRTLDIRSFRAQPDGSYHFSGLRNDTDYEVKAIYMDQSSDSKRLTVFDSRKVARIVLTLKK